MFTLKNLSLLLTAVCLSQFSIAEEHGHDDQGHEPPAKEQAPIHVSSLMEVESKVQELAAKIKTKQSYLKIMIEDKNALKDKSPELKTKVQDILKEHADLRRLTEEYNKQLNILKYRFPERNVKSAKKYNHFEVKSVIELEQAMSVDAKLNRNLKKMKSQYQPSAAGSESAKSEAKGAKPSKGESNDDSPGDSIEEAGSIHLQK